jgi:hypothetical protein
MVALEAPKGFIKKRTPKNVPDYLIYEIINGKPVYYKGYKDVLKKTKQAAEIMGSSSLQWMILSYLTNLIHTQLGIKEYRVATNEAGLHIDHRNNLAGDILIFKKEQIPAAAIGVKYAAVPAMVHIEVDVMADTENSSDFEYLQTKIDKLLDFGTAKIIWIFSASKKVLVVTQEKTWHWYGLSETVNLHGAIDFNIGQFLLAEGIEF